MRTQKLVTGSLLSFLVAGSIVVTTPTAALASPCTRSSSTGNSATWYCADNTDQHYFWVIVKCRDDSGYQWTSYSPATRKPGSATGVCRGGWRTWDGTQSF